MKILSLNSQNSFGVKILEQIDLFLIIRAFIFIQMSELINGFIILLI